MSERGGTCSYGEAQRHPSPKTQLQQSVEEEKSGDDTTRS